MEQLIIGIQFRQYIFNPFRIGVCNKDLSKFMICHQSDDLFYPVGVKLIKYIIQQKDGVKTIYPANEIKLGKLQGYQEGLLLPLASNPLNRVA